MKGTKKALHLIDDEEKEDEEYLDCPRVRRRSILKTDNRFSGDPSRKVSFGNETEAVQFNKVEDERESSYSEDLSRAVVPCRLPKQCDYWNYVKIICAAADSSIPSLSRQNSASSITSHVSKSRKSSQAEVTRPDSPVAMSLYERRTRSGKRRTLERTRSDLSRSPSTSGRRGPLTLNCSDATECYSSSPQSPMFSTRVGPKLHRSVSELALQAWRRRALNKLSKDISPSQSPYSPIFPKGRLTQSASPSMAPWSKEGFCRSILNARSESPQIPATLAPPRRGSDMAIWRGASVGRSRGGSSRVDSLVPSRRLALTYTGSDSGVGTPKFDRCISPQSPITWGMAGLGRSRLERFRCMSPQSPWFRNRFDSSPTSTPGSLTSGFNWSFDNARCDSPTSPTSKPQFGR